MKICRLAWLFQFLGEVGVAEAFDFGGEGLGEESDVAFSVASVLPWPRRRLKTVRLSPLLRARVANARREEWKEREKGNSSF